ncbi:MAG: metallophosphoesterase family protein [Eubacteriales bacterium]
MLTFQDCTIALGAQKPFCVWHLTDLHLLYADDRDGDYENENAAARVPCFPDAQKIEEQILTAFSSADKKPDFLLLTGDIIDFPTQANLSALQRLIRAAGCPYLYIPGNHDWSFPRGYQSKQQKDTYFPMLAAAAEQEDITFCEKQFGGIRFIGVDDSRDRVTPEQCARLIASLDACRKERIPAVVCLHVPIQSEALDPEAKRVWRAPVVIGDDRMDAATRRFCEAVEDGAAAVIAGHVHFRHDAFLDDGLCMQYISPMTASGVVRRYTFC